jgi:hypothetical protein
MSQSSVQVDTKILKNDDALQRSNVKVLLFNPLRDCTEK